MFSSYRSINHFIARILFNIDTDSHCDDLAILVYFIVFMFALFGIILGHKFIIGMLLFIFLLRASYVNLF